MSTEDRLQLLLEHLAKDMVELENSNVPQEKIDQIGEVYYQVYNMLVKLKSL